MSGGAFNYPQYKAEQFSDTLEEIAEWADERDLDDVSQHIRALSIELEDNVELLRAVDKAASGDTSLVPVRNAYSELYPGPDDPLNLTGILQTERKKTIEPIIRSPLHSTRGLLDYSEDEDSEESDDSDDSEDYSLDIDDVGVPRGEGESWDEAARRLDVEKALEESDL